MILHEDFIKNGREVCEDGAGQSDRSEVSGRSDRWAQGGVGIFIDGIMIRREDRELLEESLRRWRYVPERRRMEINRKKSMIMFVNLRETDGNVRKLRWMSLNICG